MAISLVTFFGPAKKVTRREAEVFDLAFGGLKREEQRQQQNGSRLAPG
ncbi:hypothetical protein [Lysobacter tyrosinilyticus]